MNRPASLESLPIEILGFIFSSLDPIGLISASQTNTKFRAVIQPKRTHFVERLLQLECGEAGGGTPIFRAKDNNIKPGFEDKEKWNQMRWACSLCLKLLPHTDFSNQYLLRLQYRKPIPESRAEKAFTSWKPFRGENAAMMQEKREARADAEEQDRAIRRRYNIAVNTEAHSVFFHEGLGTQRLQERKLKVFQDSGMGTFQGLRGYDYMTITEEEEWWLLTHEIQLMEGEKCGFKRHLRKCNECRFQRHEIANRTFSFSYRDDRNEPVLQGTAKVPIVTSRTLQFPGATERWFPDIFDILDIDEPTAGVNKPTDPSDIVPTVTHPWTMYVVRCPECSTWQELRAFRFADMFNGWAPKTAQMSHGVGARNWNGMEINEDFLNNLQCNHCYASEHGREKLGQELVKWLSASLFYEKCHLGADFWVTFKDMSFYGHSTSIAVKKARTALKEKYSSSPGFRSLDISDIVNFRLCFDECRSARNLDDGVHSNSSYHDSRTAIWFRDYDQNEARLYWLLECIEKCEGAGNDLVDWALNRERSVQM